MRLNHWTHNLKKVEFDTLTGKAKTILLKSSKSTDSICLGFPHCEKKLFGSKVNFATYIEDTKIIFNAGKKAGIRVLMEFNLNIQHRIHLYLNFKLLKMVIVLLVFSTPI